MMTILRHTNAFFKFRNNDVGVGERRKKTNDVAEFNFFQADRNQPGLDGPAGGGFS